MMEPGRVCIVLAGRSAGERVVVLRKLDDTYVEVLGSRGRRKVNMRHLHPLEKKIALEGGDEDILRRLEEA